MYLGGGSPSRGAGQPNQQYYPGPGQLSIDFFAASLLENMLLCRTCARRGPIVCEAPGAAEGSPSQKQADKTADDGRMTGCCAYKHPSLSALRPAFFSHMASCLIGEILTCRPCGFSSHHRPIRVYHTQRQKSRFFRPKGASFDAFEKFCLLGNSPNREKGSFRT